MSTCSTHQEKQLSSNSRFLEKMPQEALDEMVSGREDAASFTDEPSVSDGVKVN